MKRIFGAKSKLLVSILTLFCIMAVGSTMAYLFATTNPVTNTFKSAQLDTGINDEGSGKNKSVSIINKGDSPAWIRARLLVSGIAPENVVIVQDSEATVGADQIGLVMPKNNWKVSKYGSWVEPGDERVAYADFADAWIYYTVSLPGKTGSASAVTDELLNGVVFGSKVDANEITITATHESVLALDTSGTAPWEAAFETPAGSVPSPEPTT